MICKPCCLAGRIMHSEMFRLSNLDRQMLAVAAERGPAARTPSEFAERLHELCRSDTWCDCQHVVPVCAWPQQVSDGHALMIRPGVIVTEIEAM